MRRACVKFVPRVLTERKIDCQQTFQTIDKNDFLLKIEVETRVFAYDRKHGMCSGRTTPSPLPKQTRTVVRIKTF